MPIAGIYVEVNASEEDPLYPLTAVLCESCGLVQLLDVLSPEIYEQYRYSGATSDSYCDYLDHLAAELIGRLGGSGKRVLEVGCNDGYLLTKLKQLGAAQIVGFEPSVHLSSILSSRGIPVIADVFDNRAASRLPFPKADLIVVRHVLEHIENPNDFMVAIHDCLSPDGLVFIEVPDIESIINNHLYAHFYHEHQVYYSASTLAALAKKHLLYCVETQRVPIHGGSVCMIFSKRSVTTCRSAPSDIPQCKRQCIDYATRLFEHYELLKADVVAMLNSGLRVAGYGAAHRSVSACALAGFGTKEVRFLVDKNPLLQGLLIPGSRIPILETSALCEMADVALIFASSFEKEIVGQNSAFVRQGGRFKSIVPTIRYI